MDWVSCCAGLAGPLEAPSAKASGDRDSTAPPGGVSGPVARPPPTPRDGDLCGSELSPKTENLGNSLLTSQASGGRGVLLEEALETI